MTMRQPYCIIVSLPLLSVAQLLQCNRPVMLVVCNLLFTRGSLRLFVCSHRVANHPEFFRTVQCLLVLSRKCKLAFTDSTLSGKSVSHHGLLLYY